MKYGKRLFGYAIILLFAIALLRPFAVHAAGATLSFSPSAQSGILGVNFSITIHENSGTDAINGVQSNLDYPSSLLKVVSVTVANGWTEAQNNTSTAGLILFAAFPSPAGATLTGDQAVASITFQTIGQGTANITFDCSQASVNCPDGNAVTRASDNADILTSTVGGSITTNSDRLSAGLVMTTGQSIFSPNALYLLVLQPDGNLVLYGPGGRPLWSSATNGSGASILAMQPDGNLVLYTASGHPVWASGTDGKGSSTLYMQDDGNTVVYTDSGATPTWYSKTASGGTLPTYAGSDSLSANQTLHLGQYLRSIDGRHVLLMQPDGNLVLYSLCYRVLWASYTNGKGASFVAMQPDGNLVIYTGGGKPVWASNTADHSSSTAAVQSDGNFVIYSSGTAIWWSGTSG